MLADLFTKTGAVFTPCKRYRYRLWRTWDASKPPLVMVVLNPSIADVSRNDPTVERCQRRAMASGHGGLEVVNIFALVSTDPAALYTTADPVGPENNSAILDAVENWYVVFVNQNDHEMARGLPWGENEFAKAVTDFRVHSADVPDRFVLRQLKIEA